MGDEDGSVMLLGLLAGYPGKKKITFQIFVLDCLSKCSTEAAWHCLSPRNREPALCACPMCSVVSDSLPPHGP